jgi:hypothetical protein
VNRILMLQFKCARAPPARPSCVADGALVVHVRRERSGPRRLEEQLIARGAVVTIFHVWKEKPTKLPPPHLFRAIVALGGLAHGLPSDRRRTKHCAQAARRAGDA